jgi:cation/acetate symporter
LLALMAAGGLAAALSTVAGLLPVISSAVSHDLIKGAINREISEKGELPSARVAMAVAVAIVVATYLDLIPPGFAAQTVALALGLAAASVFAALMMGIFSKRINNHGAVAGMLYSLIFTLVYIFTYKGSLFIPGADLLEDTAANWVFGISPLSIGAVKAMLNFALARFV